MSSPEYNFEPMTTGMVLDKALRLYLQNFALLFGLSAILNIPVLLFSVVFTPERINPTTLSVAALVPLLIGLLAFLLAMLFVTPLVTGATTKAVSDIYLGNIVTAGSSLSAAWRKAWTLLKNQFIVGLIIGVGLILLVVPGILWFLSYALIAPVVMIEGSNSGREIRQRSWELVRGSRGKVFLVFFVLGVLQALIQAGIGATMAYSFGLGNTSTTSQIANGIIAIVMFPISAIAVTLLYYDFRIRKEGFDLEMLSHAIGGSTPGA